MSEPNDDLAALRRAFADIPAVAPAPDTCPPSEVFLAAVRGELPPAELRRVIEHLATCPACAEDWRLAAALEHPFADDSETAATPEPTSLRHRYLRLAAWCASAAAAAALLVAGLLPRLPTAALRGGEKAPQLIVESVMPREACMLRWSAVPGATYDLDLRLERGRIVERAHGLRETRYQIPPAKLTDVPRGAVLTWQVTANLPNGHRLVSNHATFILR